MSEVIEPQPPLILRTTPELVVTRRAMGYYYGEDHPVTLRLRGFIANRDWEEGVVIPYFAGEESALVVSALLGRMADKAETPGHEWEQAQAAMMLKRIATTASMVPAKSVE